MRLRTILLGALLALTLLPAATASASATQTTMFEAPRELLSDDAALRAQTLDEVKGFGVGYMRLVLYWRSVAPQPDAFRAPSGDLTDPAAYDWARYDRAVDEIRARGMQVLLTVSGPVPNWASRSGHSATSYPSASRFASFATAVGRHFAGRVSHYAIWNEPNHPEFLAPQYSRGKPVSPGLYRELFRAGSRGIRAGVPKAVVLIGETAPVGTGKVVAPLTFLRGALCLDAKYRKRASCAKLDADGWAHHAYTHGAPWTAPSSPNDVTIGVLGRLNSALAKAGSAGAIRKDMPIWLTEFGIQSVPDPIVGVSETMQAEYRAIAERMAYDNPRVRVFSQYLMRDDLPREGPASQRYSGFESGLRFSGGAEKRSYEGFRLPLVAKRGKAKVTLWGLVRPHDGSARVTIEWAASATSRTWHRLKGDTTNARGMWTTTTRFVKGRAYRVTRDGHAGPPTRVYARG